MADDQQRTIEYMPFIMLALAALAMVAMSLPVGQDWRIYNVASLSQIQAPYNMQEFVGMPFAFFALPHALASIEVGNAINVALNILVIMAVAARFGGKQWHIISALVITSPFGLLLIMSNNIDWIPLAAFLVADWLAYPMLAMKPQLLAGAAIIRFKRNSNPLMLLPLVAMLIVSVAIWGAWWQQLGGGLLDVKWNYAPFPYMIPAGVYLLWWAWKHDDEVMAACSTMFFVPYFAPYSLTGIHVLLASRNRHWGVAIWVLAWWMFIRSARMM
jgi:hypothetical protein